MPEILVEKPFFLKRDNGQIEHFRPTTMRLRVSSTEARSPILRDRCQVFDTDKPEPEKVKKVIRRASTNK